MGMKKFSADKVVTMTVPSPGAFGRKVIIFHMSDGGVEVFKSERMLSNVSEVGASGGESKCSYNNSMYLMRAVMNAPKGKAATREEFVEFASVYMKHRHLFSNELERFTFDGMVQQQGKTLFLTRVEFVAGLKDLGDGAGRVEMAVLLVKEFNRKRSTVARSIGRMVAVDLFIGNYDRFRIDGDLANPGNLFFKVKRGKLEVVGLDSFFETASHANYNMGSDSLYGGKTINLAALVPESTAQKNYVTKLAEELHKELMTALTGHDEVRPNQRGLLYPNTDVAWEIIWGMEEGVKDLISTIKRKKNSNRNPLQQGLVARCEQLELLIRQGR